MITTIFMLIALVCLLLAATARPSPANVAWGWLGMFFWCLSIVLPMLIANVMLLVVFVLLSLIAVLVWR